MIIHEQTIDERVSRISISGDEGTMHFDPDFLRCFMDRLPRFIYDGVETNIFPPFYIGTKKALRKVRLVEGLGIESDRETVFAKMVFDYDNNAVCVKNLAADQLSLIREGSIIGVDGLVALKPRDYLIVAPGDVAPVRFQYIHNKPSLFRSLVNLATGYSRR